MGSLGLESVLIGDVGDGELLAGLLIHPGVRSVDDSGFVLGTNVLQDTILVDLGAVAGLQDGAPLIGLHIRILPHNSGFVGAGHGQGEEGDEDDEELHVGDGWCLLDS
ncbi:hypothetical protein M5D96_006358, partial [Drosophila gunungcola]